MFHRFQLLAVCLASAFGVVAPAAESEVAFFEETVRPLLADYCYKCHGPDRQESGLRVDSLEAMLAGGDAGDLIVPGEPDQSLLVIAIRYIDEDLQMPPAGKLSDDQINDLKRWIERGAAHPDRDDPKTVTPATLSDPPANDGPASDGPASDGPADYWAFHRPTHVELPEVREEAWLQAPVDRFVLRGLEEQGLRPNPAADRRTLIRRVTFDLIGLPPTAEEIDAFLADESPAAFERVVDRLLGSVHYGERWGRHWLDVARYADSNGLDENIAHGNAWRYRDYVIDSWNNDKTYDQFILEQLAGDLLPAANHDARVERLTATGFLALGPKVLAEGDQTKMEMDIIDEQIDTIGRAILGMTLGCARCHDHKFDPITTEDYYALAGIFKSTRTMESLQRIARWHENSLATGEQQRAQQLQAARVAELEQQIKAVSAGVDEGVADASANERRAAIRANREAELVALRQELADIQATQIELPTAMGVQEGEAADIRVHVRGNHLALGEVARRGVPQVLATPAPLEIGDRSSGRLELARWLVDPDNALVSRVIVNRLWRWHFGQGLVGSVDNFGRLGEPPANQPLLDWLAQQLIDSGWSLKAVHRLILLSATYQMSSATNDRNAASDPSNRYQWRANIRRLEAEAVRDSLLAAAGLLDNAMGGSLLHVANREFFFDHTSKDETNYDTRRRSVYLPVVRNHLYEVFSLFDYSDASVPNGDRAQSTVAPQALFMLNSELMLETSRAIAVMAAAAPGGADERIEWIFWRLFGRPPEAAEREQGRRFLAEITRLGAAPAGNGHSGQPASQQLANIEAWAAYCHVLLATNEFLHVR